jgi:hypothetical protein
MPDEGAGFNPAGHQSAKLEKRFNSRKR